MKARRFGGWSAAVAAVLLAAVLSAAMSSAAAAQARQPAQQDEFVPVDELPPDEQIAAAPLVMAAYAAAWLVIFGYLWSLWRRLGRVEREVASVARRVAGAGDARAVTGGADEPARRGGAG